MLQFAASSKAPVLQSSSAFKFQLQSDKIPVPMWQYTKAPVPQNFSA